MAKIAYVPHKFNKKTTYLLDQANEIIDEYAAQGFDLTLRQLYYQMVSRDFIPNNQAEYNRIGRIISDARRAGLVDWEAIVDRTRNLRGNSHWDTPADILHSAERSFAIDKWEGQEYRPEVWVEKDALVGVIQRACQPLDVSFFACRGYSSDSEMWRAAQRCQQYANDNEQVLYVIHLGDHDPSGIDMSRDIEARFNMFGAFPIIRRIALNYDQIQQYNPPPNFAKDTDSRWAEYVNTYGTENSWELDALEPQVIVDLITNEIEAIRDDLLWQEKQDEENQGKAELRRMRLEYLQNSEDSNA